MEIYLTEIHADGTPETTMWEVEYGISIEGFFGMAFQGCDRAQFMMLVNDYPVDWDYLLASGDQVYIRPFSWATRARQKSDSNPQELPSPRNSADLRN
jgi:hypothetical protein